MPVFPIKRKPAWIALAIVLITGLCIPQPFAMPVQDAGKTDYNQVSFWHHPWGRSGTHKGVDIFSPRGTPVLSATPGLVIFAGDIEVGGRVVLILGPKWRLHYYAHLDERKARFGWVHRGEQIGTVGNTGNAAGKPAHLHYSMMTLIPYPWRIDASPQGWKKMIYLNPIGFLNAWCEGQRL